MNNRLTISNYKMAYKIKKEKSAYTADDATKRVTRE